MNPGPALFARYAYAPNRLGYCGPPQAASALRGDVAPTEDYLRELARGFSGAWPYLRLLAQMTGVADPMDARVVEAYWLGGGLAGQVDGRAFGKALVDDVGAKAGHYWKHLTPDLADEASPDHGFHVFGVYPWSRLLQAGDPTHPVRVLDQCRVRWGKVLSVDDTQIVVRNRRLTWDGTQLSLSEPRVEATPRPDGALRPVPDVEPGEWVALHWDWVADRLTGEQAEALRESTGARIAATNGRLRRDPGRH